MRSPTSSDAPNFIVIAWNCDLFVLRAQLQRVCRGAIVLIYPAAQLSA
jgi:hypothetical protein